MSESDVISKYDRLFSKILRVWRKMSEYEGKEIGLSKQVYSFIRDLST